LLCPLVAFLSSLSFVAPPENAMCIEHPHITRIEWMNSIR
jgi:hypothetical protein